MIIRNSSVSSQVIVPLPVANGIEVQIIPNNSIIINGKQSEWFSIGRLKYLCWTEQKKTEKK